MKIKKIMLVISCMVCLSLFCPCAESEETNLPEISSPCAILMEKDTEKILFEKDSQKTEYTASLMKIMNMLAVAKNLGNQKILLQDKVAIDETCVFHEAPNIWLKVGEIFTVEELLKALAMLSASDAALALANHISGSSGEFVSYMNQLAKEMNLENTIFKNCTGTDEDGNVSSARDIARISCSLMKHENIASYTASWIDHIRNGNTQMVNTNKLIRTFPGVMGIKTGTSEKAGSCISACAQKDGLTLIGVVLGAKDPKERMKDITNLLNYGFSSYTAMSPNIPLDIPKSIKIIHGMEPEAEISAQIQGSFVSSAEKAGEISYDVSLQEEVQAPVEKGQKIGEISFKQGNETVYVYNIVIQSEVKKAEFFPLFKKIFTAFFCL